MTGSAMTSWVIEQRKAGGTLSKSIAGSLQTRPGPGGSVWGMVWGYH